MDGMEKLKAIANAIYPVLGVAFMAFMLGITGGEGSCGEISASPFDTVLALALLLVFFIMACAPVKRGN